MKTKYRWSLWNLAVWLLLITSCSDDYMGVQDGTKLSVNVETGTMKDSRAIIYETSLPGGSSIGMTLVNDASLGMYEGGNYNNWEVTATGAGEQQIWQLPNNIYLNPVKAAAVAYYPFSSTATDYTAIPVYAGYTDYMYSEWVKNINIDNPVATFTMKHALTVISLTIKRGDYEGLGKINSMKIKSANLGTDGVLDSSTGKLSSVTGMDDFINIPVKGNIDDNIWPFEYLLVPTGKGREIQLILTVDNNEYVARIRLQEDMTQGKRIRGTVVVDTEDLKVEGFSYVDWEEKITPEYEVDEYTSYLTAVFNVTSTEISTIIHKDINQIKEMYIDGNKVEPTTSYTFPTIGEHVVKYRFISESRISNLNGLTNLMKIVQWPTIMSEISSGTFQGCTGLTDIPEIGGNCTKIGSLAFKNCSSLKNIDISKNVESIGNEAFYGCNSLESINIEEGNPTFDSRNNCNALMHSKGDSLLVGCKNTVIPDNCKIIGRYAFYKCAGLTSITIPNSVKIIDNGSYFQNSQSYVGAFSGCTGLETVVMNTGVTNIGKYAFYNCTGITGTLTIPESCTNIGEYAFYKCNKIAILELKEGIKVIGNNAFQGCTGITGKLTIPNSVITIGNETFRGCNNIPLLDLGTGVQTIGNSAFSGLEKLTNITIPESVTSIGNSAFSGCAGATGALIIPGSCISIGTSAFNECSNISSLELKEGIKTIGNSAFKNCIGITGTLTIPESVTSIGGDAFRSCKGVVELLILSENLILSNGSGESLNSTDNGVFYDCSNLKKIKVMGGNTNIGEYAFQECKGLELVEFLNESTIIGNSAFNGCTGLTGTLTLGDAVKYVGDYAFGGCNGITGVFVGKDMYYIGASVLAGANLISAIEVDAANIIYDSRNNCNAVIRKGNNELVLGCKNTIIPTETKIIGNGAFNGCTGLTGTLTIPSDCLIIGEYAFRNCTGITSLVLNEGLEIMRDGAFDKCTGITGTLTIPNSVKRLEGHYNYYYTNSTYGTGVFNGCTGITTLDLGTGIEYIGENVFQNCTGITGTLTIPGSCTEISWRAFYNCDNITEVICEEGLVEIGPAAFQDCYKLAKVTLPSTFTILGYNEDAYSYFGAFKECNNLKEIICKNPTAPAVNSRQVFLYVNSTGTLTVPTGCTEKYSGWKLYLGSGWTVQEQNF